MAYNCDEIERYESKYNGKNWSRSNDTWTSFPWESLDDTEKAFIKNQYFKLVRKEDGSLVSYKGDPKYGKFIPDYGRFVFFSEINLSPTLQEYFGFNRYDFWKGKTDSQKPWLLKTLKSKFVNSKFISGDNYFFQNLPDRNNYHSGKKIDSLDSFYGILKSKDDLSRKTFNEPTQEEFKLSWMRELVERGIEGEMGPFKNADSVETNEAKAKDGLPRTVSIGAFASIISNRSNYPLALYKNWLAKEYYKAWNGNTKNPNYTNNPFPKTDPGLLKELFNNGGKFPNGSNYEKGFKTILTTMVASGAGENSDARKKSFAERDAWLKAQTGRSYKTTPGHGWWGKNDVINWYGDPVIAYPSGAPKGNILSNYAPFGLITDEKGRRFGTVGKAPNPDKNYVMDGWIKLPSMFGWDIVLPWAFVWQYIDGYGYVFEDEWNKKNPMSTGTNKSQWIGSDDTSILIVKQADDQFKRRGGKGYERFIDMANQDNWLNYNARIRLWWYRYNSLDIPNREIYFLIRYKYGVAASTGLRYMSYPQMHDKNGTSGYDDVDTLFPFPNECGGIPNTQPNGVFLANIQVRGGGRENLRYSYVKSMSDYNVKDYPANKVRSHYVSLVHDIIGFNRNNADGSYNSSRKKEDQIDLVGDAAEVVNYSLNTGMVSFISGKTDRAATGQSSTELYDYHEKYGYQDIRPNHLSLSRLLNIGKKTTNKISDLKDRFVSPQFPISDKTTSFEFYNKEDNPLVTFKDFAFGLLTPKELQFLYECVSYVQYSKGLSESELSLWPKTDINNDKTFFKHRWSELSDHNIAPWVTEASDGTNAFLKNYILWAAPTDYQYYKIDFSKIKDGCVDRLYGNSDSSKKNLDAYNKSQNKIAKFPFISWFVDTLWNNRPSSGTSRPVSPAWIHYNYISGLINVGGGNQRYDDNLQYTKDGKTLPTIAWDAVGKRWNDVRSLNMNESDFSNVFGNKSSGVLLTLPNFVLGGRPDLIGTDLKPIKDEDWPKESHWGKNPFSMENGILKVGNLDAVIDSWAKQKPHNGKFVSAMEIMFWIRYRHGLAAAPSHRTIKHYFPPNQYGKYEEESFYFGKWPIEEVRDNIRGTGQEVRSWFGNFDADDVFTPPETLHNIPVLTSYYFPITSENTDEKIKLLQLDPLIEMLTPPRWNKDERTAYTGWNSEYVSFWPGASNIPYDELNTSGDFWKQIQSIVSKYPDSTTIFSGANTTVKPQRSLVDKIVSIEKSFKGTSTYNSTGFNKDNFIPIYKIQAAFRAMKMIHSSDAFIEYLANAEKKKPGDVGSVIAVVGHEKDDISGQEKTIVYHISGEPVGLRREDAKNVIHADIAVRPWLEYGGLSNQPELKNLMDDYELGTKDCVPQWRFMRHIIQPTYWMYTAARISDPRTKDRKDVPPSFYSGEQLYHTYDLLVRMFFFHSKTGKDLKTYHGLSDNDGDNDGDINTKLTRSNMRVLTLFLNNGSDEAKKDIPLNLNTNSTFFNGKYIVGPGLKKSLKVSLENIKKYSNPVWYPTTKLVFSAIASAGTVLEIIDAVRGIEKGALTHIGHLLHGYENALGYILVGFKYILSGNKYGFGNGYAELGLAANLLLQYFLSATIKNVGKVITSQAGMEVSTLFGRSATIAIQSAGAVANFTIIFAVVTVIAISIDLLIENWYGGDKIDSFWKKLNKATKHGYLEGPYAQTDGRVKIKKINGMIPAGDEKEIKKLVAGDEEPPDELMTTEEFYTSGKAKKIVDQLSDCECTLLMDLLEPEDKGTYGNRINWNKGLFRRQLEYDKSRSEILDDAPTFEDLPNLKKQGMVPDYITRLGSIDLEAGNGLRTYGDNGLVDAFENGRLGIFWWPQTLFSSHTNLCDFIAQDGKYPKAPRNIYNANLSNGQQQILTERNNELYLGSNLYNGSYWPKKEKTSAEIPYYNYSGTFYNIDLNKSQDNSVLYPKDAMTSTDTGTTTPSGGGPGTPGVYGGLMLGPGLIVEKLVSDTRLGGGGGLVGQIQNVADATEFGGGDGSEESDLIKKNAIIQTNGLTLQMFDTFGIGYMGITPKSKPGGCQIYKNGQVLSKVSKVVDKKCIYYPGNDWPFAPVYEFIVGIPPGKETFNNYVSSGNYGGKYAVGGALNFEKKTNGVIKNSWTDRDRPDGKGKYKNYINWSLFETDGTGWAGGQPTGIFVKDGIYYGAKPFMNYFGSSRQIVAANINGKPDIVNANNIWEDGSKLKVKPNVSIAAGGSYMIIENNVLSVNSGAGYSTKWPFFGKALLKDGKQTFFAGVGDATPRGLGSKILNYFKEIGGFVLKAGVGDGGGSATMVSDGQWLYKTKNAGSKEGRPVPIIIYWD